MKMKKLFLRWIIFAFLPVYTYAAWTTTNIGTGAPNNAAINIDVDSNFHLLFGGSGYSAYGDFVAAGESIMYQTNAVTDNYVGALYDSDPKYMTVDAAFNNVTYTDGDARKANSSSSTLNLPSYVTGAHIVWAGLFWQGQLHEKKGNGLTTAAVDTDIEGWNSVTMKTPDGIMHSITAPIGTKTTTSKTYQYTYKDNKDYRHFYSAYVDVTNLVKNTYSNTSKTFTVGNIKVTNGTDDASNMYFSHIGANGEWYNNVHMGHFGGWSLVVVYALDTVTATANPSEKLKNVSIYDGFDQFLTWGTDGTTFETNINLNGFWTPSSGAVSSKLLFFGGGADQGIQFEKLQIQQKKTALFTDLTNTINPLSNQYNSTFSNLGAQVVSTKPYHHGMDMDIYDVSSMMDTSQSSTNVKFGVTKRNNQCDQIFPQILGFSTQLYEPKLCYDYSLKQDGRYLSIDRNYKFPTIDQSLRSDTPVELTVYLKNKEADFTIHGASLRSDLNGTYFGGNTNLVNDKIYASNPNGSELIDRGFPLLDTPTDCKYNTASGNELTTQGCVRYFDNNLSTDQDDIRRIRKGIGDLSSEEYGYTKFTLHPSKIGNAFGDFNQSLGLTLDYFITVGGTNIPYKDYVLGGDNVPMCVPTTGYTPSLGLFNVVEHSLTATPNTSNNLKSKISRKPFDVDVIFDGKPATWTNEKPDAEVKSTVMVEMIDLDAFGDVNASCANPDAAVSKPIFVPINFKSDVAPKYQTMVAKQDSNYHNFAVKNGAFRVWYFTDKTNILREWTPIGLSDANKTITGIDVTGTKLYDAASHPTCQSSCSTPTSLSCFNCMKTNYAKPLCSRDNFSVRPEAFDIRIKDYNATVVSDLSRDVYGTSPDKSATTIPATLPQINLAAGYDYHCDVNATGYEQNSSGFAPVPGYTRHYNGMDTSYSASLYWNSALTNAVCNDVAKRDMTLYVNNGRTVDTSLSLDQIGQYRLNMMDKSWTAVDQQNRIAVNGFVAGTDCVKDSNSSVLDGIGRYGCDVVSEHTNGSLQYKDQNITFKPAKFDLSTFTYGLGKNNTAVTPGSTKFIYMSNLDNGDEMNMSLRANGKIKAVGSNGAMLSNFVSGCFARDLNITIENDAGAGFAGRVEHRSPATGALIYDLNSSLLTATVFKTVDDSNFTKVNSGELNSTIRLNHSRSSILHRDPEIVVYNDFTTTCTNAADCNVSSMREDVNRATAGVARGKSDMDFTLTHLYGRLFTKDFRATANTAFDAFTQYEVYNSPTITVDGVVETLTPNTMDAHWYLNKMHDVEVKDGNSSIAFIENGFSLPSTTFYDTNGTKIYYFTGHGTRGNYKTHIDIDPWLWYEPLFAKSYSAYSDPKNPGNLDCKTHPCFNIRIGSLIGRSGSAESGSETTKDNKNSTSTGWRSVNDYAPAI